MRKPTLETLQSRDCPAVLDIVAGALVYAGDDDENNNLIVTYNAGSYGFRDAGALITLGAGAVAVGWRGSGTSTVTGTASAVDSISITVGGGSNVVNVRQIIDPTTVDGGSGTTTINVGNLTPTLIGNLNGIAADLTINPGSNTTLNVSDYGGTSRPSTVVIDATGISGLSAHVINFGTGVFANLRVGGSNAGALAESFDVGDLTSTANYFRLDTNGGSDTVTVTGDVTGDVYLGAGDDTFTIVSGAMLTGSVHTGGQAGDVVNYGEPAFGTITGTVGP